MNDAFLSVYRRDDIQNNDAVSQYLMRKVWTELTGVCLLCSYRPRTSTNKSNANTGASTPTSVSSRTTRTSSRSSADLKDVLDVPIVDFLTCMDESDVFQRVDLRSLDKTAMRALAGDIFELYMITDIDESVYDKMFELGGGNPLYTTVRIYGILGSSCILLFYQRWYVYTGIHCV